MPYYRYEYLVQNLLNLLKEKNSNSTNNSEDSLTSEAMSANKYVKDAKKNLPKMPSSNLKFPKIPSSFKL